jgi:hypothetical protein
MRSARSGRYLNISRRLKRNRPQKAILQMMVLMASPTVDDRAAISAKHPRDDRVAMSAKYPR